MQFRVHVVGICILVGASFILPGPLSAQSLTAAATADMSLGDVCQMIGGAAALGFGAWHFAVPDLYGWWSYVPDAPQTLIAAVSATNFFFSFSLSMIGVTNIVMPLIADAASPVSTYWLWANVGLWTTRVVYQLIAPQGSHNPALQWGMAGAFILVDALMIVSALDAAF